jgi:signal peptidase I
MAAISDAPNLPDNLAHDEPVKKVGSSKRRLVAACASAILPGLGQLLLGAKRRALIYFTCLFVVIFLYWPLRLPKTHAGLIFLVWLTFFPFTASVWDALRAKYPGSQHQPRWWIALSIPLAIFFSELYDNGLFRVSGFRSYLVPSSSMEATIGMGDLFVADSLAYRHSQPSPFEIIIFRKDKALFVKRVIAGPGNTIKGKANKVFVDGELVTEPYVQHMGTPIPELDDFGPIVVPPGNLFVMGDNRDVSNDSRVRAFGMVDTKDVLGKPLYIYRSTAGGWRGREIH